MLRRVMYAIAAILSLAICVLAYRQGWWPSLLDWAVVAIPAIAGLVAWVMPVQRTTTFHRVWLFVGGLCLSGLIYLQQWETRLTHSQELARLATKDDIAKLPTVQQIGLEFQRLTTGRFTPTKPGLVKQVSGSRTRDGTSSVAETQTASDKKANPTEQITKGLEEIKHMLGAQQVGLSADQLVTLSRRMAPFAELVNGWSSSGGDLITSILGNPESNRVATGLIAALRAAGFNLPGSGMSLAVFSGTPEGIIFVLHSKEDASLPVINQFAATLKESGVAYHGEIRNDVPPGQFRLVVGATDGPRIPVHYEANPSEDLHMGDKAATSKK